MLLLGYLKHYDNFIMSHNKTNKTLDFIAKYSFGIFFIHWYVLFIFNYIFFLPGVLPLRNNLLIVLSLVSVRFIVVTGISLFVLYLLKMLLLKINKDINTRMFLGV